MKEKIFEVFSDHFGLKPTAVVRAPGRVNLIGEHTDYNNGFVLPCAIEFETLVGFSARDDDQVHVIALDWQQQQDSFTVGNPLSPHPSQRWSNYVRGVFEEFRHRNISLRGCNLAITGNVPQGAGLSSSAALEVGVAKALVELNELSFDAHDIAKIGQGAENNFVGCACGIMDQLVSAAGIEGHALGIDCRDLALTPIPVPESLAVLILHSNVNRGLVDSEYNTRREQCEAASRYFEVPTLREVSLDTFNASASKLPPLVEKRARHVLEENRRVLEAMQALKQNNIARLSELMADSHRSMRDLFEITTPEIDTLVDIVAQVVGDQGGVRMTGGGFGGCVVALINSDLTDAVVETVTNEYCRATGLTETVYLTRPARGVSVLSVSS